MRIVLIHWNEAEGRERAGQLAAGKGVEVTLAAPGSGVQLTGVTKGADAAVIDLTRLPMQGRAVGIELRKRVESRNVPLIFAGGTAGKVEEVRKVIPDAAYLGWEELPAGLRKAIGNAPSKPMVPGTMDGYSGTPLPKKLGIKAGGTVALIKAPEGFAGKLEPLPEDVKLMKTAKGADRAVVFVTSMNELGALWQAVVDAVAKGATEWIAWPKKASGVVTDVTEQRVREYGMARGWVDYKICAIDDTWSGLAFARRKS